MSLSQATIWIHRLSPVLKRALGDGQYLPYFRKYLLREKEFPNRVFNNMEAVVKQLEYALPILSADKKRLQSLTACHWIISLNLKAN
jgi:hypothetical protein